MITDNLSCNLEVLKIYSGLIWCIGIRQYRMEFELKCINRNSIEVLLVLYDSIVLFILLEIC